jgi:hypothetical protein
MYEYRRRIVLHPAYALIRSALSEAHASLHEQHANHMHELAALKAEVAELREVLQLVTSVTRQNAEQDVAALRHTLEYALARLQRRDPSTPVH